MSPEIGFVGSVLTTVALLVLVVLTGLRRRRRIHLTFVALALSMLAVTIYFAESMGQLYDLEAAGRITPVHLALAKTTVLAYLAPLTTGVLTWRQARFRPLHRVAAFLALALTALATCTGVWMMLAAERLPGR